METQTAFGSHLVTGIFDNRESAERAYNSLLHRGYRTEDIHLIMSDETRRRHFSHETVKTEIGNKAMEGAGAGSAIGGAAGAIAAAIAAIGTNLLLPGLGLVVAGPLAAALAGAGAGSIAGGLIGAMVGAGIPRERAVVYEKGINEGHIVLGVHAHNAAEAIEIEDEMHAHHAHDIHS
jgi:hypothetical protein